MKVSISWFVELLFVVPKFVMSSHIIDWLDSCRNGCDSVGFWSSTCIVICYNFLPETVECNSVCMWTWEQEVAWLELCLNIKQATLIYSQAELTPAWAWLELSWAWLDSTSWSQAQARVQALLEIRPNRAMLCLYFAMHIEFELESNST